MAVSDYYETSRHAFTSRDPLDGVNGKTTVANPYHYVNNSPLNGTDPTGLRCTDTTCFSGDGSGSGGGGGGCPPDVFCQPTGGGPNPPIPPVPPKPVGPVPAPREDPYAGPNHLKGCYRPVEDYGRQGGRRTGCPIKEAELLAAMTEVFVDTYPSGYTVYWSKNATRWMNYNSDFISKAITAVGVGGLVASWMVSVPVGVVVGAALAAFTVSYDFSAREAIKSADRNWSCLIVQAHWVGGSLGIFQASNEVADADKCREVF